MSAPVNVLASGEWVDTGFIKPKCCYSEARGIFAVMRPVLRWRYAA